MALNLKRHECIKPWKDRVYVTILKYNLEAVFKHHLCIYFRLEYDSISWTSLILPQWDASIHVHTLTKHPDRYVTCSGLGPYSNRLTHPFSSMFLFNFVSTHFSLLCIWQVWPHFRLYFIVFEHRDCNFFFTW